MRTKHLGIWMIMGIFTIGTMGFYGYQLGKEKAAEEVCTQQGKEGQDKKINSALPMWESLSRHLIMAGG